MESFGQNNCPRCVRFDEMARTFEIYKSMCLKNGAVFKELISLKKYSSKLSKQYQKISEEIQSKDTLLQKEREESSIKCKKLERQIDEYRLQRASYEQEKQELLKNLDGEKIAHTATLKEMQKKVSDWEEIKSLADSQKFIIKQVEADVEKYRDQDEESKKDNEKLKAQLSQLQKEHSKLVGNLLNFEGVEFSKGMIARLRRLIKSVQSRDEVMRLEAELSVPTPDGTSASSDTGIFSGDEETSLQPTTNPINVLENDLDVSSDSSDDEFESVESSNSTQEKIRQTAVLDKKKVSENFKGGEDVKYCIANLKSSNHLATSSVSNSAGSQSTTTPVWCHNSTYQHSIFDVSSDYISSSSVTSSPSLRPTVMLPVSSPTSFFLPAAVSVRSPWSAPSPSSPVSLPSLSCPPSPLPVPTSTPAESVPCLASVFSPVKALPSTFTPPLGCPSSPASLPPLADSSSPASVPTSPCPSSPASVPTSACPSSPASVLPPACASSLESIPPLACASSLASISPPACASPLTSVSTPAFPSSPASLSTPTHSSPPTSVLPVICLSSPSSVPPLTCPSTPAIVSTPTYSLPPASVLHVTCTSSTPNVPSLTCPSSPARVSSPTHSSPPASVSTPTTLPSPSASVSTLTTLPSPPASVSTAACPSSPASAASVSTQTTLPSPSASVSTLTTLPSPSASVSTLTTLPSPPASVSTVACPSSPASALTVTCPSSLANVSTMVSPLSPVNVPSTACISSLERVPPSPTGNARLPACLSPLDIIPSGGSGLSLACTPSPVSSPSAFASTFRPDSEAVASPTFTADVRQPSVVESLFSKTVTSDVKPLENISLPTDRGLPASAIVCNKISTKLTSPCLPTQSLVGSAPVNTISPISPALDHPDSVTVDLLPVGESMSVDPITDVPVSPSPRLEDGESTPEEISSELDQDEDVESILKEMIGANVLIPPLSEDSESGFGTNENMQYNPETSQDEKLHNFKLFSKSSASLMSEREPSRTDAAVSLIHEGPSASLHPADSLCELTKRMPSFADAAISPMREVSRMHSSSPRSTTRLPSVDSAYVNACTSPLGKRGMQPHTLDAATSPIRLSMDASTSPPKKSVLKHYRRDASTSPFRDTVMEPVLSDACTSPLKSALVKQTDAATSPVRKSLRNSATSPRVLVKRDVSVSPYKESSRHEDWSHSFYGFCSGNPCIFKALLHDHHMKLHRMVGSPSAHPGIRQLESPKTECVDILDEEAESCGAVPLRRTICNEVSEKGSMNEMNNPDDCLSSSDNLELANKGKHRKSHPSTLTIEKNGTSESSSHQTVQRTLSRVRTWSISKAERTISGGGRQASPSKSRKLGSSTGAVETPLKDIGSSSTLAHTSENPSFTSSQSQEINLPVQVVAADDTSHASTASDVDVRSGDTSLPCTNDGTNDLSTASEGESSVLCSVSSSIRNNKSSSGKQPTDNTSVSDTAKTIRRSPRIQGRKRTSLYADSQHEERGRGKRMKCTVSNNRDVSVESEKEGFSSLKTGFPEVQTKIAANDNTSEGVSERSVHTHHGSISNLVPAARRLAAALALSPSLNKMKLSTENVSMVKKRRENDKVTSCIDIKDNSISTQSPSVEEGRTVTGNSVNPETFSEVKMKHRTAHSTRSTVENGKEENCVPSAPLPHRIVNECHAPSKRTAELSDSDGGDLVIDLKDTVMETESEAEDLNIEPCQPEDLNVEPCQPENLNVEPFMFVPDISEKGISNMDTGHVESPESLPSVPECTVNSFVNPPIASKSASSTKKKTKLQKLRSQVSRIHPLASSLKSPAIRPEGNERPSSVISAERQPPVQERREMIEPKVATVSNIKEKSCLNRAEERTKQRAAVLQRLREKQSVPMSAASSGRTTQLIVPVAPRNQTFRAPSSLKHKSGIKGTVEQQPVVKPIEQTAKTQPLIRPSDRLAEQTAKTQPLIRPSDRLAEQTAKTQPLVRPSDRLAAVNSSVRNNISRVLDDKVASRKPFTGNDCSAESLPKAVSEQTLGPSSQSLNQASENGPVSCCPVVSKVSFVSSEPTHIPVSSRPLEVAVQQSHSRKELTHQEGDSHSINLQNTVKVVQNALKKYLASSRFTPELLQETVNTLGRTDLYWSSKVITRDVVKCMEDDFDTPPAKASAKCPTLTATQQQLVTLVLQLAFQYKHLEQLPHKVMQLIEYCTFRLGHAPVNARLTWLSRLYGALCRALNLRSRALIFCWDALYAIYKRGFEVVLAVLDVWPALLPKRLSFLKACPNAQVMVHMLMMQGNAQLNPRLMKLRKDFQDQGVRPDEMNSDMFVSIFVSRMLSDNGDTLAPALVLLAKREKQIWALQKIVTENLYPAFEKWQQGLLTSEGAAEKVIWSLACILRQLSIPESQKAIEPTFKLMRTLLLQSNDHPVSPCVQEALATGLAFLSRHNLDFAADALSRWNPQHASKIGISGLLMEHLVSMINNSVRPLSWWLKRSTLSTSASKPHTTEE